MPELDSALWRDIKDYLRRRHAPICRQWFEELEPIGLQSGLIRIQASTNVQQNYLQRKCLDQFTEAAQIVTGALVAVRFVNADDKSATYTHTAAKPAINTTSKPTEIALRAGPVAPPASASAPGHRAFDEIVLSPDYSFANFVTGPNNRLAYAASVAVANQPGTAYNPIFIHGGVGLGKTHLLQAISQTILNQNPHLRICYLSCDAFMNDFIDCVQQGLMNDFRHHYRHVDVLVIDDIHFLGIGKRERSQEEFFHTFNALHQSKRQIVLSSDSSPAEIPQLEERLTSRFGWGLVAHVGRPCYETRVAIVRAKMELRGLDAPDDVISYIATKIDSNARELEGALTTVQGHAALQDKPITLAQAREAMGDPASESRPSQVTLQHIIDAVTDFYNVRLSDLQSKRRHKSITMPRQICMWLARKRTRFSLEEIGGYFGGRDHTTVIHSVRTVEQSVRNDPNFAHQIDHFEEQLNRIQ